MDNSIQNFNLYLFRKVNFDWTNSFFDVLMPLLRESTVWVPLYLFLLIFIYKNFGKDGLYWFLGGIIAVVVSNFISSDLVKPFFNSNRPCRESMLEPTARLLLNRCPGSGSFTSSHATNHFTLAVYLVLTLRYFVKWSYWFLLWATVICYAQIYVGVHYPIDVIFGALLGSFIGFIAASIFNSRVQLNIISN